MTNYVLPRAENLQLHRFINVVLGAEVGPGYVGQHVGRDNDLVVVPQPPSYRPVHAGCSCNNQIKSKDYRKDFCKFFVNLIFHE